METKVMRDALIEQIYDRMRTNDDIFFVSADFGAPALDRLREDFGDRFINVGIAEQNLINIATGLALEGAVVYAYAIAPFLSMRAYEQIRTNLSILSQVREINVNLIGVGAGLSYDVTGPTHHCLEDSCIMRVLPNFVVFSPGDYVTTEQFVDYSLRVKKPKYLRLDGKAQPRIYSDPRKISMEEGFSVVREGKEVGLVSTGYMTHKALRVAEMLEQEGLSAGVVDVFLLKPLDGELLYKAIGKYSHIVTMEESFIDKGSLDSIVAEVLRSNRSPADLTKLGFGDRYVFEVGNREHLHKVNGLDEETIVRTLKGKLSGSCLS
ncbi:MAG: transketolase [Alphaproteobacteria bacterium]|uniref:Transketolase n=1 Tax=Candidatus Nitrobium versatile TaxID=2884831 RepID=A0A953JEA5_9BACT|nr:transketolase [Candidatus Nitrobium versatile]